MSEPRRPVHRRVFQGHWALPVAFIVVAVGTAGTNTHFQPPSPVPVAIVLALLALLPTVLRVPPWAALTWSGAVTGVYFAAGFAQGPIFLCLPLVAFLVVGRAPERGWRVWGWAVGAVVLGEVGRALRVLIHGDLGGGQVLWQGIGFVAVTAAAVAGASALRSRRAAVAARARSAASEERLRMAADLHDGVGHGLSVIALQAGAALHVLDRDPAAARAALESIRESSRESLELLRSQLARLTDATGAVRTPERGLADLPALVDRVRTGGLDVRLDLAVGEVSPPAGHAAYAVVQESLTNVLRHAGAEHAEVLVRAENGIVEVRVGDDGRGPASATDAGMGISGMRSRVEALGGTLEAGAGAVGFRVHARIPQEES